MSPDKFTTIDQQLVEWLLTNEKLNVNGWAIGNLILCLLSLLLSVLLCGMIGIEREVRGRSAGLRTHLLVGVGSCLLMIISMYGFQTVMNWDAARIAAAIVTGVGFTRSIGKSILDFDLRFVIGLTRISDSKDSPKTWQGQLNITYWFL